jgi:putative ABC transport system ATP-binding protein
MNMADRLVRIEDGQIIALGKRADKRWMFVQDRREDDEDPEV